MSHCRLNFVNSKARSLEEAPASAGQPEAAGLALKERNAEVVLQCLHSAANGGSLHTKGARGAPETPVVGDNERLCDGHEADIWRGSQSCLRPVGASA